MASTTRSALLRFELQMTEQSRKFGQRVKERRLELEAREPGKWEQKHVVGRLVAAGEKAINTNQLSRYENGNGPFPREKRQEAFAAALKTTAEDLRLGPLAERRAKPKVKKGASPFDSAQQEKTQLTRIEKKLNRVLDWIDAQETAAELDEGDADTPSQDAGTGS